MPGSDLNSLVALFGFLPRSKIEGRTRIQKLVCILKYRENSALGFNFHSYFYGPYSDDLAESIDILVSMKILKQTTVAVDYDKYRYDYELTEKGKQIFERVKVNLERENPQLVSHLYKVASEFKDTPTSTLIEIAKFHSRMPSLRP